MKNKIVISISRVQSGKSTSFLHHRSIEVTKKLSYKLSKITNRHKYEGNERAKLEDCWPIGYA